MGVDVVKIVGFFNSTMKPQFNGRDMHVEKRSNSAAANGLYPIDGAKDGKPTLVLDRIDKGFGRDVLMLTGPHNLQTGDKVRAMGSNGRELGAYKVLYADQK